MNYRTPRRHFAVLAALVVPLCAGAFEPPHCASSFDELRSLAADPAFPLRWKELSMADGKPLVVTITQRDGSLFLEFVKSQEGVWAQGPAAICATPDGLEARIARSHIRVGPAAHWLLRTSLGEGATFRLRRLATGQLQIGLPGWSGLFAAQPD